MMDLVYRAKQALWREFVSQSKFKIDGKGYVADPKMNLVPGLTMDLVQDDFSKGSGKERLGVKPTHLTKSAT